MLRRFQWIPLFLTGLIASYGGWRLLSMLAAYVAGSPSHWSYPKQEAGVIASALFGLGCSTVVATFRGEEASEEKLSPWVTTPLIGSLLSYLCGFAWAIGNSLQEVSGSPSWKGWCAGLVFGFLPAACMFVRKTRALGYGASVASIAMIAQWGYGQRQTGNNGYAMLALCSIIHVAIAFRLPLLVFVLSTARRTVQALRRVARKHHDIRRISSIEVDEAAFERGLKNIRAEKEVILHRLAVDTPFRGRIARPPSNDRFVASPEGVVGEDVVESAWAQSSVER